MWSQKRPTLYAGVLSCVVHILLLGIAASVVVALPHQPVPHLHVAFLQRAVPLPVQELPGMEKTLEPTPAPKSMPRETRQSKPLTPRAIPEKKPVRPVFSRPFKPMVKPRPKPPPIVKEGPVQTALTVPPLQPDVLPVPELPPASDSSPPVAAVEGSGSESSERNVPQETASLAGNAGGIIGNGAGIGGRGGPSAMPDYNVNPKPPYPLIARRIGAQGEVLLRVLVRQDGSVAIVELAQSSGFSFLDESATRTVRESWRFIPAQRDGIPVESWVEVPIKFVLAGS